MLDKSAGRNVLIRGRNGEELNYSANPILSSKHSFAFPPACVDDDCFGGLPFLGRCLFIIKYETVTKIEVESVDRMAIMSYIYKPEYI